VTSHVAGPARIAAEPDGRSARYLRRERAL